MKIGIWLGVRRLSAVGGGTSYFDRFLQMVDMYEFDKSIEIFYLSFRPQIGMAKETIVVSQLPAFFYILAKKSRLITNYLERIDRFIIKKRGLNKVLNGTGLKVVVYPSQCECVDSNFPFVSNNWDIGHRSTHSFPEVTVNNIFEIRDDFYQNVLPKSLLVICESETGKKELMDYTGLGAHKIRVMPIFAGGVSLLKVENSKMVQILSEIGVEPYKYFYYPAQYWPHKNHIGLLKAFQLFVASHRGYKLILSGSDQGNKEYIRSKIKELGLEKDVILLGFISEDSVYTFYKNSLCLVMASHFGPTNMPPIEAMEMGCPVACSDIGGHREILGDNALYFDSYNTDSIHKALVEMADNRQYWLEKIILQKGKTIFNAEYAIKIFNKILLEAVNIRDNWGD